MINACGQMPDPFPYSSTDLHSLHAAMIEGSILSLAALLQHPLGSLMRPPGGHDRLFRFLMVCVGMAELAVFPK
jgi:hypothetical protein